MTLHNALHPKDALEQFLRETLPSRQIIWQGRIALERTDDAAPGTWAESAELFDEEFMPSPENKRSDPIALPVEILTAAGEHVERVAEEMLQAALACWQNVRELEEAVRAATPDAGAGHGPAVHAVLKLPATDWKEVDVTLSAPANGGEPTLTVHGEDLGPLDTIEEHPLWCLPLDIMAEDPTGLGDLWRARCASARGQVGVEEVPHA